jgi:dipeptide/tripeptide permease
MLALLTLFLNKDVGFSTGWSTKSVSIFTGLVTITMALGGGWLSDRLGVRRALSLSMLIVLIGRIFLVASPLTATTGVVFTMAWIGLVVMGFGEGILQPALYSGVKEYTDKRTATLGYAFLYSIMNLGIVAGEFLSPLIRNWYAKSVQGLDVEQVPTAGIGGAFYFFIAVTVVVLAANVIFFTRRVELRDRIVVEEEEPASEPEISNWIGKLRSLPIMDLRFLFFIFILLPVRTLFAHQWLTMPFYVTRALPPEVGAKWEWVNMINPLVIVIGVPLIAAMTARRRVVDMMIVGTLVSALSSFLLVPHPNTIFLVTYMVIWSLGEAMWSSRFLEYVADIAPAPRVGIYMGLAGIPWFLAKFVTGFYAGNMLDKFVPAQGPQDPGTMWLIYGLTALVSPIGLILARRWLLAGELGREQAVVAE